MRLWAGANDTSRGRSIAGEREPPRHAHHRARTGRGHRGAHHRARTGACRRGACRRRGRCGRPRGRGRDPLDRLSVVPIPRAASRCLRLRPTCRHVVARLCARGTPQWQDVTPRLVECSPTPQDHSTPLTLAHSPWRHVASHPPHSPCLVAPRGRPSLARSRTPTP